MSIAAMKQFKQATGKDLWFTLLSFQAEYQQLRLTEQSTLGLMTKLFGLCDFFDAAECLHALIKGHEDNKSIPLQEIQDAMYRVGWMPSDRSDDMSDPWPLVLVAAALEIDDQFKELQEPKKKQVT